VKCESWSRETGSDFVQEYLPFWVDHPAAGKDKNLFFWREANILVKNDVLEFLGHFVDNIKMKKKRKLFL
jgi:hypothetical protein